MTDCCQAKSCELEALGKQQSRVLWIVLAINLTMFFVEMASSFVASSLSLAGDSLDMLGDSIAYGSSLYVIRRGNASKAKSAALKGGIILVCAVAVLARAIHQLAFPEIPAATVMGAVGTLALIANLTCLLLLTRHRQDDINMSSVWLCSRNDIIANVALLGAAALVFVTQSHWPVVIVGLALAALFLKSGLSVLAGARAQLVTS